MKRYLALLRRLVVVVPSILPVAFVRAQEPYVSLTSGIATTPTLRRLISFTVQEEALGTALGQLARTAELDFVIDGTLPALAVPVSLRLERTAVGDAFVALLAAAQAQGSVEIVVSDPTTLIVRAVVPFDAPTSSRGPASGIIAGVIRDAITGSPVPSAEVVVDAEPLMTHTDRAGHFAVGGVPPGSHAMIVRRLGFAPLRIPRILLGSRERRIISVALRPTPVRLEQLVITTATYSAFADPTRAPTVSRDQIERIPHFGEDAFRAVAALPGVSTDDFSAKVHVRGAASDDLRITLDGVELIDPYHIRSVGGMFSLVDARAVRAMTLAAGDAGAEHGNQLAGVLSIESLRPGESQSRGEAVADVHHLSLASHGVLSGTGGSWLVTGRYGFPDLILHRAHVTGDVRARFADLFAKGSIARGGDTLTLNALVARDWFARSLDARSAFDDAARHVYVWAVVRSRLSNAVSARTTLSLGVVRASREGAGIATTSSPFAGYLPSIAVDDARATRVVALRQDWTAAVSARWLASWGAEGTHTRFRSSYALDSTPPPSTAPTSIASSADLQRGFATNATSGGVYASHRIRVSNRVVADVGLRYDAYDRTHEQVWSPRAYLSYAIAGGTVLRGGWGRYAQFQRAYDVDVAHADTVLSRGDRADHRAISIEHQTSTGLTMRAEMYDRRQTRIRPRFYQAPSSARLFPEVNDAPLLIDPSKRTVRGVDVSLGERTQSLGWTANYSYSLARERIGNMLVRGPFDDRNAVRLEWWSAYRRVWRVAGVWRWRSGWAATDRSLDIHVERDTARVRVLLGPYNGSSHGRYNRLDLRLERVVELRRGAVSIFSDLYNALDRFNTHSFEQASYTAVIDGGPHGLGAVDRVSETSPVPMLSPLVTVGVRWRW